MNAETLAAMPEGARFAIKVALTEELRKSRTIRPAIFSLVAYDVLTTLPKERQVIWSKKPTFVTLLYLICRYGFILAQMGNLYLERAGLSAGACQKSIRSLNVPPVIVFIAGSTLFIQRLYALFDNNKKVSIPLYVLLAGSVAVQLLAIIDMKANPLPSLLSLRACTPGGHNEYFLGFHLSILGFHGVVVVATCAKIWMLFKQSDSHLLRIVLRDSLFWFVIVTLGSTANLIYYLRTPEGKNRALLAALASGFDSIAPARMLLNLRSAANGNNLSGSGLPFDSTVVSLPLTPTVPTYSHESPVAAIASPSTSHTYLAPPRSPIAMPSVKAVADRRSRLF